LSKQWATVSLDKQIIIEDLNNDIAEFKENNKAVYLSGYYTAEKNLAFRLKTLITHHSP